MSKVRIVPLGSPDMLRLLSKLSNNSGFPYEDYIETRVLSGFYSIIVLFVSILGLLQLKL